MNKLRTTGLLVDKQQKHKRRVLTEKLHDIRARLEHTPRKSLKGLAQETRVSTSNARTATQLLKPPSKSWCLVCCKYKKEYCTCVFNKTIKCKKYLRVERTAFSAPPVICELSLLHTECYQPSGMLIYWQNSHAPSGRRCTGRREAQSREQVSKNPPCRKKYRNTKQSTHDQVSSNVRVNENYSALTMGLLLMKCLFWFPWWFTQVHREISNRSLDGTLVPQYREICASGLTRWLNSPTNGKALNVNLTEISLFWASSVNPENKLIGNYGFTSCHVVISATKSSTSICLLQHPDS
jgi:hypothetical protein